MATPDTRRAAPEGRDRQAFPRLDAEAIERLRTLGKEQTLPDGTVVFERGQRTVDFFLVLDGAIEIYDYDYTGHPAVFTVHGPSQFTGELDLFNDRKILVGGRTAGETRVVRLDRVHFRRMLATEPELAETITRAFILRRLGLLDSNIGAAVLVGRRQGGDTLRVERFLRGNGYPVRTVHAGEDACAEKLVAEKALTDADLPALACHGEPLLRRPSNIEVAETVGLVEWPDSQRVYDVAVVGAGPGGLASAVYAASEGLDTVVLDREGPGGQASTSSKIENYLGFPNGLSGQELAGRAQVQAQRFGATLALPMTVTAIEGDAPPYTLHLAEHEPIRARSVVVATGARYRTLGLANCDAYEGRGVHYAATAIEGSLCQGEDVVVVGGGNSAGQAAVFLSRRARHVYMLVRGEGLAASMSDYLIRRIEASPSITLCCRSQITELAGDSCLEQVTWSDRDSGDTTTRDAARLFLMIGAEPNTDWLADRVRRDERGFLLTGADMAKAWPLERPPEAFETSLPGVFAVGDARSGSVKRVASAVGEGSVCVQFVHRVLATTASPL